MINDDNRPLFERYLRRRQWVQDINDPTKWQAPREVGYRSFETAVEAVSQEVSEALVITATVAMEEPILRQLIGVTVLRCIAERVTAMLTEYGKNPIEESNLWMNTYGPVIVGIAGKEEVKEAVRAITLLWEGYKLDIFNGETPIEWAVSESKKGGA